MEFKGKKYQVNGIEMHVVMEGTGPDVLLVHGFPDSHAVWRYQIPALVAAGYRVIAPDLRGFGLTEMPAGGPSTYKLDNLRRDIIALLDVLGIEKVRLVGHDWGAVISWQVAIHHPERLERYIAMSVGHPTAYATGGFKQKLMAYYIGLILIRGFSEWLLKAFNWTGMRWMTRFPLEMPQWIAEMSPPGRLTAAMNLYRANAFKLILPPFRWGNVHVPVVGIYSTRDVALVEGQMVNSEQYCKAGWRYVRVKDVGHWMTVEAPEIVTPLLIENLR